MEFKGFKVVRRMEGLVVIQTPSGSFCYERVDLFTTLEEWVSNNFEDRFKDLGVRRVIDGNVVELPELPLVVYKGGFDVEWDSNVIMFMYDDDERLEVFELDGWDLCKMEVAEEIGLDVERAKQVQIAYGGGRSEDYDSVGDDFIDGVLVDEFEFTEDQLTEFLVKKGMIEVKVLESNLVEIIGDALKPDPEINRLAKG